MPDRLSKYFTLEEMTVTQTGIKNVPDDKALQYLKKLCETMDSLREKYGPIIVSSGFRSPEVEIAVSGKAYGQHMLGQACDWWPQNEAFKLKDVAAEIIKSDVPFDQLILERPMRSRRGWLHLSIAPNERPARKQPLMYGFWTLDENGKMRYRDFDLKSVPE